MRQIIKPNKKTTFNIKCDICKQEYITTQHKNISHASDRWGLSTKYKWGGILFGKDRAIDIECVTIVYYGICPNCGHKYYIGEVLTDDKIKITRVLGDCGSSYIESEEKI